LASTLKAAVKGVIATLWPCQALLFPSLAVTGLAECQIKDIPIKEALRQRIAFSPGQLLSFTDSTDAILPITVNISRALEIVVLSRR
jgi:hypothetical protein